MRFYPPEGQHDGHLAEWLLARFDNSLLVLGDLSGPLVQFTTWWFETEPGENTILGVAARFEGFDIPILTIVADEPATAERLLRASACETGVLVAVNASQPLPDSLTGLPLDLDTWYVARCETGASMSMAEPLQDDSELKEFYDAQGLQFWCPAMLDAGPAFGIRSADGHLVCAGGVNFIVDAKRYAQIGALATDPAYRNRGLAGYVINALRSQLCQMGIETCGLFAETARSDLAQFYTRRGFEVAGHFRFINIP